MSTYWLVVLLLFCAFLSRKETKLQIIPLYFFLENVHSYVDKMVQKLILHHHAQLTDTRYPRNWPCSYYMFTELIILILFLLTRYCARLRTGPVLVTPSCPWPVSWELFVKSSKLCLLPSINNALTNNSTKDPSLLSWLKNPSAEINQKMTLCMQAHLMWYSQIYLKNNNNN